MYHQAGAAAALYVDIIGLDAFLALCKKKLNVSANPKYAKLREEYFKGQLIEIVPDQPLSKIPPAKMIKCEIFEKTLPENEFSWYDTGTETGQC